MEASSQPVCCCADAAEFAIHVGDTNNKLVHCVIVTFEEYLFLCIFHDNLPMNIRQHRPMLKVLDHEEDKAVLISDYFP